jgi:hypothetical protein
MTPILLAALAIVDAAFAGFRAAAGRNARIFKREYYARSMRLGALSGVMLVVVLAGLTGLLLANSDDPAQRYAELVAVGQRMLWVFVPYAVLVLSALALYLFSDHDLRAFATVAILGPFTLLRPWVVVGGAAVGLCVSSDRAAWFLTVSACGSVVLLGRILDRRARLRL